MACLAGVLYRKTRGGKPRKSAILVLTVTAGAAATFTANAEDGLAEAGLLYPHGSRIAITEIDSAAGMNDPLYGRVTLIFDGLREIQHRFGYLPADALKELAKKTDVPLYRLHGV